MFKSLEDLVYIAKILSPIIALCVGWFAAQFKNANKEDRAIKEGVKMLLRVKLIDKCLHYIKQGSIPPYALETIKGLYSTYLSLGDGDPAVGDLVARVEKLQIRSGGE